MWICGSLRHRRVNGRSPSSTARSFTDLASVMSGSSGKLQGVRSKQSMVRDHPNPARHRLLSVGADFVTSDDPEITEETPRVESASARSPIGWRSPPGWSSPGVVLVALITLFVATRRGLDLTDESDYIQSELHAGAYIRASTEFQLLLGPVLSLVRHVWLLTRREAAGSRSPRTRSSRGASSRPRPRWWAPGSSAQTALAVAAAIIAGGLGVSRVLPQTPGYNDLTVFLVVTVSGLLLLLADRRVHGRARTGRLVRGRPAHLVAVPRAMAIRDGDRPARRDRVPLDRARSSHSCCGAASR